jgi:hypothetical protein
MGGGALLVLAVYPASEPARRTARLIAEFIGVPLRVERIEMSRIW